MKFKALPSVIALTAILAMLMITSRHNAAADGIDKLGFPFIFYLKFDGKSPDLHALRHYFSYLYLIGDAVTGIAFIGLTNILFPLILNKNRLKQTA